MVLGYFTYLDQFLKWLTELLCSALKSFSGPLYWFSAPVETNLLHQQEAWIVMDRTRDVKLMLHFNYGQENSFGGFNYLLNVWALQV